MNAVVQRPVLTAEERVAAAMRNRVFDFLMDGPASIGEIARGTSMQTRTADSAVEGLLKAKEVEVLAQGRSERIIAVKRTTPTTPTAPRAAR